MITQESYNKTFKSLFESFQINQEFIMQSMIDLPFQIPVSDGFTVLSNIKDRSSYWSMLFFTSISIDQKLNVFNEDIPLKTRKTLVTLCVIGPEFHFDSYKKEGVELIISDEHSYFFDKSLDHLNAIILAYSIQFQDEYVYQITKFDLAPFCGYELIETKNGL